MKQGLHISGPPPHIIKIGRRALTLFNNVLMRTTGHYHHRLWTVLAPFWFSMKHHWTALTPFWLSTNVMLDCKVLFMIWGSYLTMSGLHCSKESFVDGKRCPKLNGSYQGYHPSHTGSFLVTSHSHGFFSCAVSLSKSYNWQAIPY